MKNLKKIVVLSAAVLMMNLSATADEGMWMLTALQKIKKEMKSAGLKMPVEKIYSEDGRSLNSAIVIFGGGCTAEVVSESGLLLTNYHCGFGAIQQLSGIGHNYIENGFWAMNRAEELPVEGLTVTFVKNIVDVTSEFEKSGLSIREFEKQWSEKNKTDEAGERIDVRSFYAGNEYYAFRYVTYSDIRLVGTPPHSIGQFGDETDNWMWPRHTCDFSMFRIYGAPDGSAAEYAAENVPLDTPCNLTISLKGYKPGDFTMIMGFPGSTERYATSSDIKYQTEVLNANRILIRGERQKILMENMLADEAVRIKYASKYAGSSNYWKNSIGANRGVKKLNVVARKAAEEREFTSWAVKNNQTEYQNVIESMDSIMALRANPVELANIAYEALYGAIEILRAPGGIYPDTLGKAGYAESLKESKREFYKDFDEATDRRVAVRMIDIVRELVAPEDLPEYFTTVINGRFGGDAVKFVDWLYDTSLFANQQKFEQAVDTLTTAGFNADPARMFSRQVATYINSNSSSVRPQARQMDSLNKLYQKGLHLMQPERKFYPDANFTQRLSYGNVRWYSPADGVEYDYYTTMLGVMQKEDPSNPYDFTVSERQKQLYNSKMWGGYDQNGKMRLCFLTTNDITGGNSGSPVMNAKGQLIGLAFDGNWEAMSGDIAFEPELQRTICVDIRYVLWTIDVYGGAGYLLDEMRIIK